MSPGLAQYRTPVGQLLCYVLCILIVTGCNMPLIKPITSTPSAHAKAPVAKVAPALTFGPPAPSKTAKSVETTIQGIVTDVDHPVKGLMIEMHLADSSTFSQTTQTDEKGFFAFHNMASGSYLLAMTISVQQRVCRVIQVAKVEKDATANVDFNFPATIYMQGQIALLPNGSIIKCEP